MYRFQFGGTSDCAAIAILEPQTSAHAITDRTIVAWRTIFTDTTLLDAIFRPERRRVAIDQNIEMATSRTR
jgi:hypothetical protein